MSSSQLDPYDVAVARPPEPPAEPDPAQAARETQQALFAQEHGPGAWSASLSPARGGRQRSPVPAETAGEPRADGVDRKAMCILGPDGAHVSRGLHCPHRLPDPGDSDDVLTVDFWP